MQSGKARRKRATTKPLRDAALVLAFLALAATATVSVDTGAPGGGGGDAVPAASDLLAPATHATESVACPEHEELPDGEACLQANLAGADSGLAAHEDLIRALRSLGIRIEIV